MLRFLLRSHCGLSYPHCAALCVLLRLTPSAYWLILFSPHSSLIHSVCVSDALLYCVPGVVTGLALLLLLHKFQHFLLLPTCMVMINVVFYATMFATGNTLSSMQGPADHVEVGVDKGATKQLPDCMLSSDCQCMC